MSSYLSNVILAGGKSASALAAPGKLKKISEPRRGDRKHSISVLHRFLSPLPGLHFNLSHSGGYARFAGLPPASVLSPTSWAQNSSGFQPDKFQFSEFLEVPLGNPAEFNTFKIRNPKFKLLIKYCVCVRRYCLTRRGESGIL